MAVPVPVQSDRVNDVRPGSTACCEVQPEKPEQGRTTEFLGVRAIVIALAAATFLFAQDALAPPIAKAAAAPSGQS